MKEAKIKDIKIFDHAGVFAENKDVARELRNKYVLPTLRKGKEIILDYKKVSSTTQSFTHALISEAIREFGDEALEKIVFKNCNNTVKEVIEFVAQYMQQAID